MTLKYSGVFFCHRFVSCLLLNCQGNKPVIIQQSWLVIPSVPSKLRSYPTNRCYISVGHNLRYVTTRYHWDTLFMGNRTYIHWNLYIWQLLHKEFAETFILTAYFTLISSVMKLLMAVPITNSYFRMHSAAFYNDVR